MEIALRHIICLTQNDKAPKQSTGKKTTFETVIDLNIPRGLSFHIPSWLIY